MKAYTVVKEIWRNGIRQEIGSVIHMVESEAKYLAHALEEKVADVEAKAVVAVKKVVAQKAPGVAVSEAPANGETSN